MHSIDVYFVTIKKTNLLILWNSQDSHFTDDETEA